MLLSIPLLHVLWFGLVLSLRNVRTCGGPRMTYRTLLPGLRLHLCSSGTSTLTSLPTVIVRTRYPPNLRRSREFVSVAVNRTVMHSNRGLAPFFFHNLPGFMKSTMCGDFLKKKNEKKIMYHSRFLGTGKFKIDFCHFHLVKSWYTP
jgi:hypothetical protein